MATLGKRDIPSSQLGDIASLIQVGAPLFFPQKSMESATGPGLAYVPGLLDSLTAQATSTSQADAVVANILQKSAIAFQPTLAAGAASGGYNSTVITQLQNEARARAVGEASAAVLQSQTQAAQTAAQLAAATSRQSVTSTKQAPLSVSSLLPLLTSGYVLNKMFGDPTGEATGFNKFLKTALGPKSQAPAPVNEASGVVQGGELASAEAGTVGEVGTSGAIATPVTDFSAGLTATDLAPGFDAAALAASTTDAATLGVGAIGELSAPEAVAAGISDIGVGTAAAEGIAVGDIAAGAGVAAGAGEAAGLFGGLGVEDILFALFAF